MEHNRTINAFMFLCRKWKSSISIIHVTQKNVVKIVCLRPSYVKKAHACYTQNGVLVNRVLPVTVSLRKLKVKLRNTIRLSPVND